MSVFVFFIQVGGNPVNTILRIVNDDKDIQANISRIAESMVSLSDEMRCDVYIQRKGKREFVGTFSDEGFSGGR